MCVITFASCNRNAYTFCLVVALVSSCIKCIRCHCHTICKRRVPICFLPAPAIRKRNIANRSHCIFRHVWSFRCLCYRKYGRITCKSCIVICFCNISLYRIGSCIYRYGICICGIGCRCITIWIGFCILISYCTEFCCCIWFWCLILRISIIRTAKFCSKAISCLFYCKNTTLAIWTVSNKGYFIIGTIWWACNCIGSNIWIVFRSSW